MSLFASFFGCFLPKSGSRVNSIDGSSSNSKVMMSLEKPKRKADTSRAPVIVSYFPVGSNLSRL
ncbi:hypothetical protein N665_0204s0022 [Sinapis alba]|nr:hypothetical protein N665_0204s0022 [Sinapis alba]